MIRVNKYDQGKELLFSMEEEQGKHIIDSLDGMYKDLGKYIIEFAFGEIYARKQLDLQQREIITLVSLLSQGDTEAQLYFHIKASLNVGVSKEIIIETFIQCVPYVGFPKVLNAISVAKKIFEMEE